MKLRLLRDFLPRPLPLKIFIPRSFGHSADTSYPSTNQDREARRHSDKAEHPNPAPIGHFYRFLCRAKKAKPLSTSSENHRARMTKGFSSSNPSAARLRCSGRNSPITMSSPVFLSPHTSRSTNVCVSGGKVESRCRIFTIAPPKPPLPSSDAYSPDKTQRCF